MSQFWPPKITIKFLGNSWNNFKYRMCNTSWNMTLYKISTWFRYMTLKKSMTFRSLLKNVRKGAYFYPFILSAHLERRPNQDSYCDYICISQIYMAGRNINLVQIAKSHYASELKNKQKIWLFMALTTVNCKLRHFWRHITRIGNER